MTDSDEPKSDSGAPCPGPEPASPPRAETAGEDDLYSVSEPEPDSPELRAGVTTPEWYVATAGGQKEGPLGLLDVQQRVRSGRLGPEMLVWKDGMPSWARAGSLPELFEGSPTLGPPPLPPFAAPSPVPAAQAAELLAQLDRVTASPAVYRVIGRVCAVLAALMLLVAVIQLLFASEGKWIASWTTFLFSR